MLYPRAGSLALLVCVHVPGLAMPSVCVDREKRRKALPQRGCDIYRHL